MPRISWLCGAAGCCTDGLAKLVPGNVENGKAPTLLRQRLEIRLDKNLNRLFAGINLDTNRRIAKVHLVASSVLSSNDGVGHYRLALRASLKISGAHDTARRVGRNRAFLTGRGPHAGLPMGNNTEKNGEILSSRGWRQSRGGSG